MFKNKPAKWKVISDINSDDEKVRLIGRVVDHKEQLIIIDDGTGTIIINSNNLTDKKLKNIVLVVGTVHQKTDGKFVIEAEIIKEFDYFNFELYLRSYHFFEEKY